MVPEPETITVELKWSFIYSHVLALVGVKNTNFEARRVFVWGHAGM